MYCDDMELSEGQGAAWCTIRSVLNPKSATYNYPTLVSSDEGGIKTRSVTTTEKLGTFASQLEGALPAKSRKNGFDEEVKTDVDAELDQPIARAQPDSVWMDIWVKGYDLLIPFNPDIHPDRIRFGEVTDILGKINTSQWPGPHHQQNHTLSHSYISHHSPGLVQHLRLPRLSP